MEMFKWRFVHIINRGVRAKKVKVLLYLYTLRPFSLSPLKMYISSMTQIGNYYIIYYETLESDLSGI